MHILFQTCKTMENRTRILIRIYKYLLRIWGIKNPSYNKGPSSLHFFSNPYQKFTIDEQLPGCRGNRNFYKSSLGALNFLSRK